MDRLLDVNEVAAQLSVGKQTVYRLVSAGLLASVKVGLGKTKPRIRIAQSSVERFQATGTRP